MNVLLLAFSVFTAAAPAPTWTIKGLTGPDSVSYDESSRALYVSNIGGFITKATLEGKVSKLKWVDGLKGPRGMKACGGRLFVADIDQIVIINLAGARIERRIGAPGAKGLDAVVTDKKCQLYVSDRSGGAIYRVASDEAKLWMDGPRLESPNGLYLLSDKLVVAAWGSAQAPGRLLSVDLLKQGVSALPGPRGNLDGIEPYKQGWLVSDGVNGTVLRVAANGKTDVLLLGLEGPADIGIVPAHDILLIPESKRGALTAYKLTALMR